MDLLMESPAGGWTPGLFFPRSDSLGLQKLPQYEYSVLVKYAQYGKPGWGSWGLDELCDSITLL